MASNLVNVKRHSRNLRFAMPRPGAFAGSIIMRADLPDANDLDDPRLKVAAKLSDEDMNEIADIFQDNLLNSGSYRENLDLAVEYFVERHPEKKKLIEESKGPS